MPWDLFKRKDFSFIDSGYDSLIKKNYESAIAILERGVASSPSNPYPMFLLAVALIYTNNFAKAAVVLDQLQRIDPHYDPLLQLNAFLALKSAVKKEEAVNAYVAALEKNPADKELHRALKILEKNRDFESFQRNVKLHEFVIIPKPKKVHRKKLRKDFSSTRSVNLSKAKRDSFTGAAFIIIAIITVFFFAFAFFRFFGLRSFLQKENMERESSVADKVDLIELSGSGYGVINKINTEKTKEFYTSPDLVLEDFNRAKILLKKGNYNEGVVILNRIINSNASFVVKEKCEFLVRYVMEADDRAYEEIDIKELNLNPHLYRGASVMLKGKVANLSETKKGLSFSLMVDFDGSNFKGIAHVYAKKGVTLSNGNSVEVKGVFITGVGTDNVPYISAEEISLLK
ncbi:MAG: Tetratricopeptide repeat protein [Spirochaetes bacterium ADurb.Bin218]|jgi:tetratricopeptide (TPR) repeat protein|nr:MAG: Tetratricopeptide repeat protein [Spirochaetes bacterium ADurb.Bin218]